MAELTQSLSSKTETNLSIKWTCDEDLSKLWYSVNNGAEYVESSEAGTDGSIYISNLAPNTTYKIVLKGRLQSGGEEIFSPVLEIKTYDYPYCYYAPDFTIGDRLTLYFYNPLDHEITVNLIGDDGSVISKDTITGRTLTGFIDSVTIDKLYKSIKTKQKANYYVKVTYEDITPSTVIGGVYSVNLDECAPTIGDVSYKDVNPQTVNLTKNDQYLVRNKSIPEFTANGISAKKYATILSVIVKLNETDTALTLNEETATGTGNPVNSAISINATFIVTDSRGVKTTKQKLVNIYDWFPPEGTITVERPSSTDTGTVTASSHYASIGRLNSVTLICYKKKLNDTDYTLVGALESDTPFTFEADSDYDWNIKVTITDSLNGVGTYYKVLERYLPLTFFDAKKYSVGINCMPTNPNTLEIKNEDVYATLFYSANDAFVVSDKLYCAGILLNNEVFFTIPIPKSAKNVTPELTTLKLNACKNSSGFLFSGGSYTTNGYDVLSDSSLTATITKATNNQLMVKIHSNTSITETNLTQVIVELDAVTIDFV